MKSVGVALGGGGVRGLAHVAALETIDAFGVSPVVVSGTSMGAIIGAMYASGQSGEEIRRGINNHIVTRNDNFKDVLNKTPNLFKWLKFVSVEMSRGGFLGAEGLIKYLIEGINATTFEELSIPFYIVATNFWSGEEVVFSSGELLPALRATMAIPGVFTPIVVDDRVLVDGGVVNNVPYDLLIDKCDCTVAIDVSPTRTAGRHKVPNMLDSALGVYDMLVDKVMEGKIRENAASIYFKFSISDVRVLEFDKIESVLDQAQQSVPELKTQLERELLEKED